MKRLVLILILTFSVSAFGQKSAAELDPQHGRALESYLKTRAGMSLRPETVVEREYLASMQEMLGAGAKTNYAVGDFNRDRRPDFAVLLNRPGKPRNLPPGESQSSSEHFPDFPLHLVVFNGGPRSTFRPAFTMNFYGPRAAFIHFDKKAGRLFYGVFETDSDTFSLTPRGSGYRVKNEAL